MLTLSSKLKGLFEVEQGGYIYVTVESEELT